MTIAVQIPANGIKYPVIMMYKGNPKDAILFFSNNYGVRVGSACGSNIGKPYITNEPMTEATSAAWVPAPTGTTFLFTQD